MQKEKKTWKVIFHDFTEIKVVARNKEDAETLAKAERIIADLPSSVRRVEETM